MSRNVMGTLFVDYVRMLRAFKGIDWSKYVIILVGLIATSAGVGNFLREVLGDSGVTFHLFDPKMTWLALAVFGLAPCQCLTPGGHQSTSPGRISSMGPPQHWVQPSPAVTINDCPSGCVCHAERAPGSNVTDPAATREGSWAWMSGSTRTVPVKYSSGPFWEGCDPFRFTFHFKLLF